MGQNTGDEPDDQAAQPARADAGDVAAAPLERPPEGGAAEQLQRRAQLAEDRLSEVLAAYRQVRVENEGFRERMTRDLERQLERRSERLVLRFIEVLDNLDRALDAAEKTCADSRLIEGLILVRTQLLQILQKEGLERTPALGLPFDPAVSEAVGTELVQDPDHEHLVVRELMRGYRLNGKVVRASRVVIGVRPKDAAPPPADDRVGADEVLSVQAAQDPASEATVPETPRAEAAPDGADPTGTDAAAETIRLDEATLRAIFSGSYEEPED